MHALRVPMDAVAVAGCRRTTGGPVIAAYGQQPLFAGRVMLSQDRGGDGEVPIRVQQVTGVDEAVCVVTDIDLPEAGVDARSWHLL